MTEGPLEHVLEKESMDAVKALAKTNVEISNAKAALEGIKKLETEYLSEREEKVIERVEKVLEESAEILAQATQNYNEVHDLCNLASSFATFLIELQDKLLVLDDSFNVKATLWEKDIKSQEEAILELKKNLKADSTRIENDKKSLIQREKSVRTAEKKVADQWKEIDRAIKRLKEGRI